MPSRRCPYCDRHWPVKDAFKVCPSCREDTVFINLQPMPDGVAEDERLHAEFSWWLLEHDRL